MGNYSKWWKWTSKPYFLKVANILKISVRGFFLCQYKSLDYWTTQLNRRLFSTFEIKYFHNIPFMLSIVEYKLKLVAYNLIKHKSFIALLLSNITIFIWQHLHTLLPYLIKKNCQIAQWMRSAWL
jgi:hypothetical protein